MWTKINEFPSYEINQLGQIRNSKNFKLLSQSISSKGYYQVNIGNKSRRIHRLLAETFIPNPLKLETVNHIDGNKTNNNLSNLEWMSRSENVQHSRKVLGNIPIPYSKSASNHHLLGKTGMNSTAGKKIKAILPNHEEIIFGSAREAAEILFGNKKLGRCIRQSIKRKTLQYKNIKFSDYESDNNT